MSRCILHGHQPTQIDGKGAHAGQTFTHCAECGLPLDASGAVDQTRAAEMKTLTNRAIIAMQATGKQYDFTVRPGVDATRLKAFMGSIGALTRAIRDGN